LQQLDRLRLKENPYSAHTLADEDESSRRHYCALLFMVMLSHSAISEDQQRMLQLWLPAIGMEGRQAELCQLATRLGEEGLEDALNTMRGCAGEICFLLDCLVFCRVNGPITTSQTALLEALAARGIAMGHVTLHVGAGTFQPVRVDDLKDHVMHREWLNVGAELVQQIRRTREAGGRVIGVGTTVVRALESAMRDGELVPYAGETQIFITPGYRIRSVDAMVTNFHLPESTLLMMISAFAGRERVFEAYAHAIAERYRFFSYGDAMLLFPGGE